MKWFESVEGRITKILDTNDQANQRTDLLFLAKEIGCSTWGLVVGHRFDDNELIRRIRETAAARRAERSWWFALASAGAAIIAALAAWAAVFTTISQVAK